MKSNFILFIDSGIGGISTLKECLSQNIKSNFIYFADNYHCPYGSHTKKEICSFLKKIISNFLLNYNIKFIVIACNTATASAIDYLRQLFPNIEFIGTEPAIFPAYKNDYKKILVIATPTTIKQKKYRKLINSPFLKIKNLQMYDFAEKIEEYFLTKSIRSNFNLLKIIFKIKKDSKNYECLILGCTHYVLIKDKIEKYIDIPIFDGNYGVAKMLNYKINKNFYNNTKNTQKTIIKLLVSDNNSNQKQKYIKILKQILANK